jgi:hypothetical protein
MDNEILFLEIFIKKPQLCLYTKKRKKTQNVILIIKILFKNLH